MEVSWRREEEERMFCCDWLLVRFFWSHFLPEWVFSHPSKDDSCASRSTAITVFTKRCFLFIKRMEKKVNQDSIWRLQFVYSACDEIKRHHSTPPFQWNAEDMDLDMKLSSCERLTCFSDDVARLEGLYYRHSLFSLLFVWPSFPANVSDGIAFSSNFMIMMMSPSKRLSSHENLLKILTHLRENHEDHGDDNKHTLRFFIWSFSLERKLAHFHILDNKKRNTLIYDFCERLFPLKWWR